MRFRKGVQSFLGLAAFRNLLATDVPADGLLRLDRMGTSESNPADILSRQSESLYVTESGSIDVVCLPSWTDVSRKDKTKVSDAI